jgi:hypothetical protein
VALVALLAASTVLFAIGVIAERSDEDGHAEPAAIESSEASEPENAHEEGEVHAEEDEALLGVDVEATPLVVLAVLAALGLAALAGTRIGQLLGFLLAVVALALAWGLLDVREAIHQLDESRTGMAIVAIAVAVLHLSAAAVAGRLAHQRPAEPHS